MNNFSKFPTNLSAPEEEAAVNHLYNAKICNISLPNQDGSLLRLDRNDTFRIILYVFPMTGNPDRPLPDNWNNITGAKGCTLQNCSFRDNYDELIKLNALPVGVSTQSINDLREMTARLKLPYDILSDENLMLKNELNLPSFLIKDKFYLKRLTLIIEKTII
ncbi:redoxin domain-containing protein, partial [Alphaproteobacteria bacterium]|nr:redoxin domain-containing protein [Alphaproteobacteria bacterium]